MNSNDRQIQSYLLRVETELQSLPVKDRAQILLRIDEQIRQGLEQNGGHLQSVLSRLGPPEQLARREATARGFQYQPPPRRNTGKYVFFGIVAVLAMSVFAGLMLVRSLFPLIDVNEEEGTVKFFGGRIDLNDENSQWSITTFDDEKGLQVFGSNKRMTGDLPAEGVKELQVTSKNGNIEFVTQQSDQVSYDCKLYGGRIERDEFFLGNQAGILTFEMIDRVQRAQCRFSLPPEIKITASMGNGQIRLQGPRQETEIQLGSGQIHFQRAEQTDYLFEAKVENGILSGIDPNLAPSSNQLYQAKLVVSNGEIRVE